MPKTPPKDRPPDWPASAQSRWFKPLTRFVMRVMSRYSIEGGENIPDPPAIFVSNHMSYFDVAAVIPAIPYGTVGFSARKYQGTWKEPFFEMGALIWITQFSADRGALRAAVHVLEYGEYLAVAPEGTRSKDAQLHQGTEGAAYLASRTGAPLVPVAVFGTDKILKRLRPRAGVRIGKPFQIPKGRLKGDEMALQTDRIMCAIAALLPEEYHGVYAGNPLIEEMARIVC